MFIKKYWVTGLVFKIYAIDRKSGSFPDSLVFVFVGETSECISFNCKLCTCVIVCYKKATWSAQEITYYKKYINFKVYEKEPTIKTSVNKKMYWVSGS